MFLENIKLSSNHESVVIIDQTLLPNELKYIELKTREDVYEAIYKLKVRGAPAIGICAAYSIYMLANKYKKVNSGEFRSKIIEDINYLSTSRPTAVNLTWALNRMLSIVQNNSNIIEDICNELLNEAISIHNEDIVMCKKISEYGLSLVNNGDGILTHCNAGPLATSKYGTALGPLILGKENNINFKVFADETRPLLQGARLTSYELYNYGIDVTLICDNMVSTVMKNGWIQACFVGCDRIAANGDFANKIGTSGVAIIAKYYNIPMYALAPTSTIDLSCATGSDIKIEIRDNDEIKSQFFKKPIAPDGVKCYNPSFDITNHELVTAIITEKGICRPPYNKSIKNLFK